VQHLTVRTALCLAHSTCPPSVCMW
jgi:hypothetical protein